MKNLSLQSVFIVTAACLWSNHAHAYIDPGIGSVVIQIIAGAIAGLVLFWKQIWIRVKSFFGKKPKD